MFLIAYKLYVLFLKVIFYFCTKKQVAHFVVSEPESSYWFRSDIEGQ